MRSVKICIAVTAIALTLSAAGCKQGQKTASASKVPTSTATEPPAAPSSPTAPDADEPAAATKPATGQYEGTLVLTVRHNYLVGIGTAGGKPIHSPEGAEVGTPLEKVQEIYGNRGRVQNGSDGKPVYIVPAGDKVMVFTGHPIRDGVGWIEVGMADHTQHHFLTGKTC
jgi:hypothetical protein